MRLDHRNFKLLHSRDEKRERQEVSRKFVNYIVQHFVFIFLRNGSKNVWNSGKKIEALKTPEKQLKSWWNFLGRFLKLDHYLSFNFLHQIRYIFLLQTFALASNLILYANKTNWLSSSFPSFFSPTTISMKWISVLVCVSI